MPGIVIGWICLVCTGIPSPLAALVKIILALNPQLAFNRWHSRLCTSARSSFQKDLISRTKPISLSFFEESFPPDELRRRHAEYKRGSKGNDLPIISQGDLKQQLYGSGGLWETDMHAIIKCGEGAPQFRLAYMPMRNRCEVPRLLLAEARCPYELEVIGFKVWPNVKLRMPQGKVPVLYNYDGAGHDLAQEIAITQFLARKLKLAGKTDAEEAAANMLYQQYWSTFRNNGVTHDGQFYSPVVLKDLETRSHLGPAYCEMHRVNNFSVAERSLAALDVFEERLKLSGTGFLIGDAPTYVDLAVFVILFELAEDDRVPDFATRFRFPHLGSFFEAMLSRPQIQDYLESDGRIPRYSRPVGLPGSQARMESGYIYCKGCFSPEPK